jgi:hypothetical protein
VLRRWRDAWARNPLFRANRARRPVGTVPWPGGAPPRFPGGASDRPGRRHPASDGVPPPGAVHAVDYRGRVDVSYAPTPDGHPDPGEVVWTWVPYEDDPAVGKDRPVVVLGRALDLPGHDLATVMLSSREHPGDPRWLLVGSGAWDAEGRPSSVRVDRVLSVAPAAVRREGSALDRARFDRVAAAVTAARGRR